MAKAKIELNAYRHRIILAMDAKRAVLLARHEGPHGSLTAGIELGIDGIWFCHRADRKPEPFYIHVNVAGVPTIFNESDLRTPNYEDQPPETAFEPLPSRLAAKLVKEIVWSIEHDISEDETISSLVSCAELGGYDPKVLTDLYDVGYSAWCKKQRPNRVLNK